MAKVKAPEVTFSLTLGKESFKGVGPTVADALIALPKPKKITTAGTVVVTDGEKTTTQHLFPVKLKRLFYNPTYQKIIAKNFERAMK